MPRLLGQTWDIIQVADALDRGLDLVDRCGALGRLQAIMTANEVAACFANVAKDLQLALLPMDLAELGCDEITQKQLRITLEQLGKVQAPFPEEQQRRLIQLRKLAEAMRVAHTELKSLSTAPPDSAASQLRDLIRNILDGCVMHLLCCFVCERTQKTLKSSKTKSMMGTCRTISVMSAR